MSEPIIAKVVDERIVNRGSLFRNQDQRLSSLIAADHSDLNPLELLACIIVESGGGIFIGLQRGNLESTLVLFSTHWGATLALPVLKLSSRAVKERLRGAHKEFGYSCCSEEGR